jgi:hypothetical protein
MASSFQARNSGHFCSPWRRQSRRTRGERTARGSGEGGTEEGANAATDLGRVAAPNVRFGRPRLCRVWRQAPGVGVRDSTLRGAPLWSTWACPRSLRSWPRCRGHPSTSTPPLFAYALIPEFPRPAMMRGAEGRLGQGTPPVGLCAKLYDNQTKSRKARPDPTPLRAQALTSAHPLLTTRYLRRRRAASGRNPAVGSRIVRRAASAEAWKVSA